MGASPAGRGVAERDRAHPEHRDLDQRIGGDSWCFASTRDFGSTRISGSVLPPAVNVTLIVQTQNVTHYDVVNSRPADHGLSLEVLERDTGRKFQNYQI